MPSPCPLVLFVFIYRQFIQVNSGNGFIVVSSSRQWLCLRYVWRHHWCRQLWGHWGTRPPQLPTVIFSAHFRAAQSRLRAKSIWFSILYRFENAWNRQRAIRGVRCRYRNSRIVFLWVSASFSAPRTKCWRRHWMSSHSAHKLEEHYRLRQRRRRTRTRTRRTRRRKLVNTWMLKWIEQ